MTIVYIVIACVGQTPPGGPLGYVAARARTPPTIDGKLDDPTWQAAPWTSDFVDIEGPRKPAPRFRTRAKMLWDDEHFYIAAQLDEPHIWATLTRHDAVIFHDNDFEVFLDPDGDNQNYDELELNALNTTWDLFLPKAYRDGGPAQNERELEGLKTAVSIDGTLNDPSDEDRAWSVEIAIPWKALAGRSGCPIPPKPGDQWRINFSRVEWVTNIKDGKYEKVANLREDNWVWSPQGLIDMHQPEHWGFVQFSDKPPGQQEPFRRLADWPARAALMRVYHAQRAYRAKHKAWAKSLAELEEFLPDTNATPLGPITIQPDDNGYEARVEIATPEDPRIWSVRHDSKLRVIE
jgi:hypothetical protein